jgi:hypothetical protein
MEAARTSETSNDNYFTRQYIPEDNSELHTRRRENLKSRMSYGILWFITVFAKVSHGPWTTIHSMHTQLHQDPLFNIILILPRGFPLSSHNQSLMKEARSSSETSVNIYYTVIHPIKQTINSKESVLKLFLF